MKKKLSAMLVAIYLLAGCGSGGGVSGAGGIGTAIVDGLVLSATLSVNDFLGVDAFISVCEPAETEVDNTTMPPTTIIITPAVLEDGLTTRSGTFTITITNYEHLTDGLDLFPTGIIIESYQVDFMSAASLGAPVLTSRENKESSTILTSDPVDSISVILVDLGSTLREFIARTPDLQVYSYNISVTARGRAVSGGRFFLTASTFIEIGEFDRCTSDSN